MGKVCGKKLVRHLEDEYHSDYPANYNYIDCDFLCKTGSAEWLFAFLDLHFSLCIYSRFNIRHACVPDILSLAWSSLSSNQAYLSRFGRQPIFLPSHSCWTQRTMLCIVWFLRVTTSNYPLLFAYVVHTCRPATLFRIGIDNLHFRVTVSPYANHSFISNRIISIYIFILSHAASFREEIGVPYLQCIIFSEVIIISKVYNNLCIMIICLTSTAH